MPINSFLYPAKHVPVAYEVANSCRFEDSSDDGLNRTLGTPTNNYKWTISFWLKRTELGVEDAIMTSFTNTQNRGMLLFRTDDRLEILDLQSDSYVMQKKTNRQFRDVSAWYHIVISSDATLSSPATKFYVNGVEETSFATTNEYTQNQANKWNSAIANYIGNDSSTRDFSGYLAEFVFIDGQALAADQFGEFDSDSPTIWKPIDVSGLTFGNNGFYLDFEDSSNLGNDANGGTDWTVSNLTAVDQSTDTCTNNFATLNSLANLTGSPTFSEGNLKVAGDNAANNNWQTTFVVSSGKWYWELKDLTSSPDGSLLFYDQSTSSGSHPGYGFVLNTKKKVIGGSPTGSAIGSSAQNDIWSMALDLDNGKMFIARNGAYLESGDPENGTNPFIQTSDGLPSEGVFGGHIYDGSMELNFGGGTPTSISSGNADDNGYGNFEYDVPAGFYSLCTKNLAEFG